MRFIAEPEFDAQDVFLTCVDSMSRSEKRDRLQGISGHIANSANEYRQRARNAELYTFEPHTNIANSVTAKDMVDLYNNQLVAQGKPGRRIYESLMSIPKQRKCPYCGVGTVTTLDHYLAKTKFPIYSVLPLNLVAACRDCNADKRVKLAASAEEQTLHPYFDNSTGAQWLFATVTESNPIFIHFFVNAPEDWENDLAHRVNTHFEIYKLAEKFSVEAAAQLSIIQRLLVKNLNNSRMEFIRADIQSQAEIHKELHLNSWQTAMYQALAASDWFCSEGFRQTI